MAAVCTQICSGTPGQRRQPNTLQLCVSMEQILISTHYSPSWSVNTVKSMLGDLSSSTEHTIDILRLAMVIIFWFFSCYNPFEDKVSQKRGPVKRTD